VLVVGSLRGPSGAQPFGRVLPITSSSRGHLGPGHRGWPAAHHPPVPRPLPYPRGRGADRRGSRAGAGGDVAGAPRHALRGCVAGVLPPRARMAAPAPREWHYTYPNARGPRPRHLSCAASMDAHTDGPAFAQITVRVRGVAQGGVPHLGRPRLPAANPYRNVRRSARHLRRGHIGLWALWCLAPYRVTLLSPAQP
jgi:hypothetical protein